MDTYNRGYVSISSSSLNSLSERQVSNYVYLSTTVLYSRVLHRSLLYLRSSTPVEQSLSKDFSVRGYNIRLLCLLYPRLDSSTQLFLPRYNERRIQNLFDENFVRSKVNSLVSNCGKYALILYYHF